MVMPRKQSAKLQYRLQIREALRRRLAHIAKVKGVSLNYEMTSRLEQSLEMENLRSIDKAASDISTNWEKLGKALHKLGASGDLKRAAEALLAQLEPRNDLDEATAKAVAQVRDQLTLLDQEAQAALREMSRM
jgi:hypothetical protein